MRAARETERRKDAMPSEGAVELRRTSHSHFVAYRLYIVGRDARRYKLCNVPFLDQQKHPNYTKSAHYKVENYTLLL